MQLKKMLFTLCYCSAVWTEIIASLFADFPAQYNVSETSM
jgi:hypothetical protein